MHGITRNGLSSVDLEALPLEARALLGWLLEGSDGATLILNPFISGLQIPAYDFMQVSRLTVSLVCLFVISTLAA